MIDPTLPSATEQGEIPSMALAASSRSSRFEDEDTDEMLLFRLREEFQEASLPLRWESEEETAEAEEGPIE